MNVGAVSILAPIDKSVISIAEQFISKNKDKVDAIFIWSESPGNGRTTYMAPASNTFIRSFFTEGDDEDRLYMARITHIFRIPGERRYIKLEEIAEFFNAAAKDQSWMNQSPSTIPPHWLNAP